MRPVIMAVAILCALTAAGAAQQDSSTPDFEAASVKPAAADNRGWSISYTADSVRAVNATLAALIVSAYGVRDDRLAGGPNWVRTARFDVNAKAAQALPREQLRLMTRHLLESRFGLALTKEQRDQDVYFLRLARGGGRLGPDLRRSADDCLSTLGGPRASRPVSTPLKSSTGANPTFSGTCATVASLAQGLSRSLGMEVIDQTGLEGRWDYVLAYAPLTASLSPAGEPGQAGLPTVFAAVQELLGLKLVRDAHGSVEYVIIAAAHAPSDN
jgi:uncharacterized protein (TIGR03435 family)